MRGNERSQLAPPFPCAMPETYAIVMSQMVVEMECREVPNPGCRLSQNRHEKDGLLVDDPVKLANVFVMAAL